MKKYLALFFLNLFFCTVNIASANTAYYKLEINSPHDYNDELYITIRADEDLCKHHYGEANWYIQCNPNIGIEGKREEALRINPSIDGYFEWISANTLQFEFEKDTTWTARQSFDITFPSSLLPKDSVINTNSLSFTLPDQAMHISKEEFYIDPTKKNAHIININAQFLYPIDDKEAFLDKVRYESNDSNLRLGEAEYIWSRNDTFLTMNIPVLELAQKPAFIDLLFEDMKRYDPNNYHMLSKNTNASFEIPGLENLLQIKSANLRLEYNKDLQQEYLLEIESSLQVTGKELAEHLKIFSLPQKVSDEARRPFNWEIAQNLEREEELDFTLMSPADEADTKHTIKISTPADSYIVADLSKGLLSTAGLSLFEDKSYVFYAPKLEANIAFLQSGNILNMKGDKKLYLQASELTSIQWEAEKIRLPYLSLLAANSMSFHYNSQEYESLSDVQRGEIILEKESNQGKGEIIAFDLSEFLANTKSSETGGIINLKLKGMQNDKEVFTTQKLLMITDIGLIVKKDADGKRQVFTYSMSSGTALANVELEILGANGLAVAKARSDNSGMAILENVDNLTKDKKPVVLLAKKGEDISFVSMNDLLRNVQMQAYDIGGRVSTQSPLQAYVFSERGIFRPGDLLNFSAIIRNNDNSLPKAQPLKALLYNSRNIVVFEEEFTLSEEDFGLSTFSWQSNPNAFTGNYRFDIMRNDKVIGSQSVSVEEFQPDTLKIEAKILPEQEEYGWIVLEKNKENSLEIQVDNLYGIGAQNRKIETKLNLTLQSPSFSKYPSYIFSNPYKLDYQYLDFDLPKLSSNKEGKATNAIDFSSYVKEDGIYSAKFFIEGFEPAGGRGVSTSLDVMLSPLTSLIGYKSVGAITNLHFIPQNKEGKLEIINIDSKLTMLDNKGLNFVVYKKKYHTNLVSNNQKEYYYDDVLAEEEISREALTLENAKILWDIPTKEVGEYILKIYEENNSQALASIDFNIMGNELVRNPQTLPSTLSFSLSDTNIEAGDRLELSLALPYDGFGLITLEANAVLSHAWFKAKAGASIQEIAVPENYEGKAYVSVSYLKNMDAQDAYLSPLAFAVEPVLVNISKRNIALEIDVPQIYSPNNKEEEVEITLKSDKASKAILFAVDEGILSLDSFQSPSPLNYFLKDRALEVTTSQLSDLIMQEFSKNNLAQYSILERSPFGGGMMAKMESNAFMSDEFVNPFKRKAEPPFVYWSGIIDISEEGTKISFPIPTYYNGNLRIMAVAVNDTAFGSAQENVIVKNDVVIQPQMPLMASPKDRLEASVMLANTTDSDNVYTLNIVTSKGLKLENAYEKEINLKAKEEKNIPLTFFVEDNLGEASVTIQLANDASSFERESTLSIRPSTLFMTDIELGTTAENLTLERKREIYPYKAKRTLSISSAPLPYIQAMLAYLDSYPFDCTEQKISKALPYLTLSNAPDFLYANVADKEKAYEDAQNTINDALYAIRNSYRYGYEFAGLTLWENSSQPDKLLTVYAGEFFLAMRKAGLLPPQDIEDTIFSSIAFIASQRPSTLEEARVSAYAIWLLTREGSITTQYIENILNVLNDTRNEAQKRAFNDWQNDITALFILASQELLHMDINQEMLTNYRQNVKEFKPVGFLDSLAVEALALRVYAHSFPELLKEEDIAGSSEKILMAYNEGYSTFSFAQAISALWELARRSEIELSKDSIACTSETLINVQENNDYALMLSSPLCTQFEIKAEDGIPLYYQLTTEGYSLNAPTTRLAEGLEVEKTLLNAKKENLESVKEAGEEVIKMKLGDTITISITANAQGMKQENIVIQDLFAGAFEPVLEESVSQPYARENGLEYKDVREDRALFFTSLGTEQSTYTYEVKVVNKGRFVLPAVYVESMYDNSLRAHDKSQIIVVE